MGKAYTIYLTDYELELVRRLITNGQAKATMMSQSPLANMLKASLMFASKVLSTSLIPMDHELSVDEDGIIRRAADGESLATPPSTTTFVQRRSQRNWIVKDLDDCVTQALIGLESNKKVITLNEIEEGLYAYC